MEISNDKIIELALYSIGPQYKDLTLDQLEAALTRRIALMRAAVRPNSPAIMVFNSLNIIGKITAVEHEDSSNRDVIHFVSENIGEDETIRTRRLDTTLGRQVAKTARECVGREVVIVKVLEPTKDPSRKVRIAYDIQPL